MASAATADGSQPLRLPVASQSPGPSGPPPEGRRARVVLIGIKDHKGQQGMAKGYKGAKVIIICGPTASGKTGWGVEFAKKFNGEIVSADSRQVYRGLDIGSGKDLGELKRVKYHMIDIVDPGERFTLFNWLEDARKIIDDILAREKTPIVVGGTGLYVQALTEGFELEKNQKSNIKYQKHILKTKKYLREELDKMGLAELQKISKKLQPKTYNLDINNPRRLIRFIERAQTGEYPTKQKPPYQFLQIAPDFPREELYQRIDKRVDERFREGMLNEVADLINFGVDANWLISLGLEYRIITSYLVKSEILNSKSKTNSKLEIQKPKKLRSYHLQPDDVYEEMKQELKYKIHNFARKQMTWFRRFPEINWARNYREAEKSAAEFLKGTSTD